MLFELIVFFFFGILAGTFTGLIPGIHINLVGVFLVSLSASILGFIEPIYFVVFIVAMAITHTFVDFIPSVFLGCPDTDTELSVLPGHELLKDGQGYQAVMLTCYGSLAAILIFLLTIFPFILVSNEIYEFLRKPFIMSSVLITASVFLVALEKKKTSALLVFLLSGFLGLCVLNMEINQPMLPLLTGLFGGSMLIMSIKNKIQIPLQKLEKPKEEIKKPLAGAFLGSLIASPLCSFLPGLGSGQAAIIGNTISKSSKKGFLVLLGATNTLVMSFSFITLYTISRTRTGAAAAVKEIINTISLDNLLIIFLVIVISGIIAFFITEFIARILSSRITKISYTKLSSITLLILLIVVGSISGILGIFVLAVSTLTGIYCISLKVRRTQMMGCLLIPTIIWYLL
ncbi:MAG: tripartite tricarboxylate transporter permease [Nanoarchaeota archaeon]|nr:tripartite tricarboxylate transporter permease [Nanoarchaeota archaeon]